MNYVMPTDGSRVELHVGVSLTWWCSPLARRLAVPPFGELLDRLLDYGYDALSLNPWADLYYTLKQMEDPR